VDTLELCNREGDEEVEEIDEKGMEEGTEVTSESSPGQRGTYLGAATNLVALSALLNHLGLDEEKES